MVPLTRSHTKEKGRFSNIALLFKFIYLSFKRLIIMVVRPRDYFCTVCCLQYWQ